MTTAKRATAGVQERRRPVVIAPPRGKLEIALDGYFYAVAELEELHAKVARAEADMVMVSDGGGSEAESLAQIADAQSRKVLYSGRILAAGRKLSDRLQELRVALVDAMREQTDQVRTLVERKRESVIAAVYAALGTTDPVAYGEIARLTRVCPAIRELERLLPGNFYEISRLAAESVVATSQSVMRNAGQLEELI